MSRSSRAASDFGGGSQFGTSAAYNNPNANVKPRGSGASEVSAAAVGPVAQPVAAPAPANVDGVVSLELEHALGFTQNAQGLAFHPDPSCESVLYGCGRLVIISNLHDCHDQRLLRGHDAPVTAVDISCDGKHFVSGQQQAIDGFVSFNLWECENNTVTYKVTTPHKSHIDVVKFSPDAGMIATTGAEGMLCIWDAGTGKKVASYQDTISGDRCLALCWGKVSNPGTRNQRYSLYAAFNTGVRRCELSFSVKTLNFELVVAPCAMPGAGGRMGGFQRKFLSCAVLDDDLLCGTSSGDVLVFNAPSGVYRTALTLAANGVTGICVAPAYGSVVVCGGDGSIKKIVGKDTEWTLAAQIQIEGAVVAATISADQHQVAIMTTAGLIYRLLVKDLSHVVALESPLGGLTDVAVSKLHTDYFASTSRDGLLRVWDLSTYQVASVYTLRTAAKTVGAAADTPIPTSVCFDDFYDKGGLMCLVSGWSDGRVRAVEVADHSGTAAWTLPNAHKGNVHTVRVCATYVMTAGDDAVVRIWSRTTRELVAQLQGHKLPTTSAAIDNTTSSLIFSISMDMCLFTYNLAKNDNSVDVRGPKRVASHSDPTCGGFLCVTQRLDREHEIIIGTVEGKILFFDLDFPEPVMVLLDANRARVTSLEISPDGKFLASGLGDGSIAIYALDESHSQRASLQLHAVCHSSAVIRCTWTTDGRQLVSAGGDGELIVWNFFRASNGQLGLM